MLFTPEPQCCSQHILHGCFTPCANTRLEQKILKLRINDVENREENLGAYCHDVQEKKKSSIHDAKRGLQKVVKPYRANRKGRVKEKETKLKPQNGKCLFFCGQRVMVKGVMILCTTA